MTERKISFGWEPQLPLLICRVTIKMKVETFRQSFHRLILKFWISSTFPSLSFKYLDVNERRKKIQIIHHFFIHMSFLHIHPFILLTLDTERLLPTGSQLQCPPTRPKPGTLSGCDETFWQMMTSAWWNWCPVPPDTLPWCRSAWDCSRCQLGFHSTGWAALWAAGALKMAGASGWQRPWSPGLLVCRFQWPRKCNPCTWTPFLLLRN